MLLRDLVWQGVVDEIQAVGLLDLAHAIDWTIVGDASLAERDIGAAISDYREAISLFKVWSLFRHDRYRGGGIWEPEISMEFRYPRADIPGRYIVINGAPSEAKELPGMTPEWEIRALKYEWQEYTKRIGVQKSGSTAIVNFEIGVGAKTWTWGVSHPVLPSCRHRSVSNSAGCSSRLMTKLEP
jgi:hypothetical protein